jgi:signal transduction histidine kinase
MKRLLRRLLPTRIAAQMAAVVIISLVLIQVVVSSAFHFLHEPYGPHEFVHIGTLVHLVAAETPGSDRQHMMAEVERAFPELHARLTRDPPQLIAVMAMEGGGPELLGGLAAKLTGRYRVGLVAEPRAQIGGQVARTVAIGFSDDEWLVLDEPPHPPPPAIGPLTASLSFGVICALLLGLWAARNLVRPLRSLAIAARDFDIEAEPHPLIVGGPEEVRVAARAFDAMRARIRTLVEDRTGMLAAMGHDLRTPITRLRLRAEFLTDEKLRAEFLRDLGSMNDMIEGALTYLREGRHQEKTGLVDLAAMLETICDQFVDMGHAVTYEGPDHLARRVRPHALTRALTNLVDNATKYGTRVEVRLSATDKGGCRIEVEDDGPGIPAADRDAMLRPFARGDAARNMNDGSGFGLGLAIVRAVVEGHRGTVTLADGASGGLLAIVDLPV